MMFHSALDPFKQITLYNNIPYDNVSRVDDLARYANCFHCCFALIGISAIFALFLDDAVLSIGLAILNDKAILIGNSKSCGSSLG